MLVLDETPYQEPKEVLQVAPTGIAKASGMAALKLPVGIAGAGLIIAGGVDELLFGRDNFFKLYDEEIKPIQEKLTPEPSSVSDAGRFLSGIAGFAPALALGPAAIPLLAGSGAINAGVDLVEQGVDPKTATGAAMLAGGAGVAMAGIPAAGKTWGKTLALMAFNPVIGGVSTQAEKSLLEAAGRADIAENYDPFDIPSRGIDAVLGLAFGAMGKYANARREMLTRTKDSIDTIANWQRMFKDTPFDTTAPKTADLGYKAMRKALADISEGKPVDLSGVVPDVVPIAHEKTPVRAEAAEAKQAIVEAVAHEAAIEERRDPGSILRRHVEKLGTRISKGDKAAIDELLVEFKDPVSGAHNNRAFEIMEQAEGPAPIIMSADIKGLHAFDSHFGQKAGDDYVRTLAKAYEDEGIPVYRYGKKSDEFLSRHKDQAEAFEAKKRVEERLKNAIIKVPTADGGVRYFTNLEAYIGIGGHYGERSAQDNAFSKVYEQKRSAKSDPDYNRESLPGNFVELSPEEFAARQAAGWSDVLPAAEKPQAVAPKTPWTAKGEKAVAPVTVTQKSIASEVLSIIEQSRPEKKVGSGVEIRDERGERTGDVYVETSNLPKHLRNQGITRGKGKTDDILRRIVVGEPITELQYRHAKEIIGLHSSAMRYEEMSGYGDLWKDPVVERMEERLAREGDFPVHTGTDAEGATVSVTARQFIDQAKAEYKALEAQKDIYSRISDCLG